GGGQAPLVGGMATPAQPAMSPAPAAPFRGAERWASRSAPPSPAPWSLPQGLSRCLSPSNAQPPSGPELGRTHRLLLPPMGGGWGSRLLQGLRLAQGGGTAATHRLPRSALLGMELGGGIVCLT